MYFVKQWIFHLGMETPTGSFTKEVNLRLAKCPLVSNGHLANLKLTSLVKGATEDMYTLLTTNTIIWIFVK